MSELKPCPLCGGASIAIKPHRVEIIICPNGGCPLGGHAGLNPVTREQWNNRPTEDAMQARIGELETELTQTKELLSDSAPYQDMLRTILSAALINRNELIEQLTMVKSELSVKGGMLERMIDRLVDAQKAAVQWVTFDGEPETMPAIGSTVLFDAGEDGTIVVYYRRSPDSRTWCHFEPGHHDFEAELGDRWAYLPQIEEGQK